MKRAFKMFYTNTDEQKASSIRHLQNDFVILKKALQSIKNYICYILFFAPLVVFTTSAQNVNLSGRAVSNKGGIVNGATVKLVKAKLQTTTATDGTFSLYKNISDIDELKSSKNIEYDGDLLILNNNYGTTGKIEFVSLNGQIINSLNISSSDKYIELNPRDYISASYIHQIVLMNIVLGTQHTTYKLYIDDSKTGYSLINDSEKTTEQNVANDYLKAFNAPVVIDTLIFEHSSYITLKKTIDSYNQNLGDITLTKILNTNANLSSLTISSGTLTPVFNTSTVSYTVNLSNNLTKISLTATLSDANASMKINNVATTSGIAKELPLTVGANTISILVTAENATTTKTYTITVNNPKPSVTFAGGTLDNLKAYSSTLEFANLTITGELKIPASVSTVTLSVDNFTLDASIKVEHPTCRPFYTSPNLIVNATNNVNINKPIYLYGKSGSGTTATSTCNKCDGENGGYVTINAVNIYVRDIISTYGGYGAYTYVNGTNTVGCNGGAGGNITLNASGTLDVKSAGAQFAQLYGGDAGTGNTSNGTKGIDGKLYFSSSNIKVEEHRFTSGEANMLKQNSQLIDYKTLTITGNCAYQEEFSNRDKAGSFYILYSGGVKDWVEDIYILDVKQATTVKINMTATNSQADLDLILINSSYNGVLASSTGTTSTESISYYISTPGKYYIGVSYADDGKNATTSYTLQLAPKLISK